MMGRNEQIKMDTIIVHFKNIGDEAEAKGE